MSLFIRCRHKARGLFYLKYISINMDSTLFNFLLGSVYLIFRLWLVEFKLKEELEFRRHYLSRMLAYFTGLVILFDYKNMLMNFIIISALPVVIVSILGWDSLFFVKFNKRTYWKKNKGWLIIERITMHFPMAAIGILLYIWGLPTLSIIEVLQLAIYTIPVLYMWFWVVDKRWSERYIWPTGLNIFIFATLSILGTSIYLVLH